MGLKQQPPSQAPVVSRIGYIAKIWLDWLLASVTSLYNGIANINPATITMSGELDLDGQKLTLDSDGDTYIQQYADDRIHIYLPSGAFAEYYSDGLEHYSNDANPDFGVRQFSTNSNYCAEFQLIKSHSSTISEYITTIDDEHLGRFVVYGQDGENTNAVAARIVVEQDGNATATRVPGAIVFQTSNASASNNERMRIAADGGVHLNSAIKSGASQAAAGAATNEIWKTSGHATLPDNVLMVGV